jgi:internalin A
MTCEELLTLIDQAAEEGWKELDLSGNGLMELPPEIGKLTQLETLILGKVDKWEWVNGELVLKLITNELKTLPEELAKLENLKTLNLSGNPLTTIPKSVFEISSLKSLTASRVGLSEIPEAIRQLTNLTKLYLWKNLIHEIPSVIGQLMDLTVLELRDNQITEIPAVIGQLMDLTVLELRDNQITEIPAVIGRLTSLTVLTLSHNQIREIPQEIGQLKNLSRLNLISNQIREIPEFITQLTNLTELYLSNNQITEIPPSIAQLTNLTELYLSNNQITEIPPSIAQLTNLAELSLSGIQITEIPQAVGQLTNLTELYLAGNQISEIPAVITQLKNLTLLNLSHNQIRKIPQVIGQLTNLTRLSLGNNQISEVPAVIEQLTNLTRLELDRNKIEELPDWLEALPNITRLDLRRNPLPISPEVLGPVDLSEEPGSIKEIFNYLRRMKSGEVLPLNEAKLLLVGQGSVGKTSLIERLLHNTYNPTQPQTDGLEVKTWDIRVNSKDVRLNVWDFGGQEIYHATHQFFLTKRSLYLLVCNCRTSEEENRIEYWLKLIESFGGDSPVIIVGNKRDEQPLDLNRKALRDKYHNIKAILETSCQTSDGIEALRQEIINQVAQLKEVYDLLPLSWFEVKESLKHLDKDCISYDQYIDICTDHTITSNTDQKQLIGLLHNLGLVLNFNDHPILQSTNVLKPQWVTEGIYALLSDEPLRTDQRGILTHTDLSRILNPQRYPAHRHHFLTELMKEFELCFQLANSPTLPTFLIPGLLPKEEPPDTTLADDTLEFQYHYPILPDSIISRFIVLMHEKIHNQTYWRSGVMLFHTEGKETCNIARIKTDPADAKIFISINGRETTRRSFLAMIRDVFNKIHNSFGNLGVTEWVPVPAHPDHPPLDYQELLGLEEMGIREHPIGKLKIKVNIRQLLDGYEAIESRQRKRMGEEGRFLHPEYHIYGDFIGGDKVGNDKVGSDKIGRDKMDYS